MTQTDPYPTYTKGERIADAAVHGAALVVTVGGMALLIAQVRGHVGSSMLIAVLVYGATLIGSFAASACYHFSPREGLRPLLRRIDHAAIYLKIAGTYTPLVILIGSSFAYGVLGLVWVLTGFGAVAKLFFWARPSRWGVGLYVGLGWLSVALLTSLPSVMPAAGLVLIILGGLIYTIGAVIFSLDGLRYQNAIWHGFVLVASLCFFAAIAMGVLAQG